MQQITNLIYTTTISQNKKLICQVKHQPKVPENLRKEISWFFDVINSWKSKNF